MPMSSQYLRIFQQPRSAILLILGFASGLPLALTSGTLQAWMTVENIDLKTIGFFSLVGQAYVFKFLWSPLMDRYTPPFLGVVAVGYSPPNCCYWRRLRRWAFLNPARNYAGWRHWRW